MWRLLKVFLVIVLSIVQGGTVFSTQDWETTLSGVIHSDVTQSVKLPNGKILWVFGDTMEVNGQSTVGAYGYPHNTFVVQEPGTLTFSAKPGAYGGYGWQQVPNWPDGTYFWPTTVAVDGGTVYVIGVRVNGVSPFTVVGPYMASFDPSTLSFRAVFPLPLSPSKETMWGGISKGSYGWWITGTHRVDSISCDSYATDCFAGDMAYVPYGSLGNVNQWLTWNNIIPTSANIGSVLAMTPCSTGGWDLFTKLGDAYGGTQVLTMHAGSPIGTWGRTGVYDAPSPPGTYTYGVAVHPEQSAPTGQILVSYNVDGSSDPDYHARWLYLPR